MKLEFGIKDIKNIVKEQLLPKLKEYSIFTFTGPLGSGKTTLIKELLKQCGVKETITSPSFTYLNIHKNNDGKTFHHFDLYLLKDEDSFTSVGFEELLFKSTQEANSFALIEWPEIIKPLLQDKKLKQKVLQIFLSYKSENLNTRIIEIISNKNQI
jgi:tRNA threonylcarbamoyladenosine biosynthesis protein TsaE